MGIIVDNETVYVHRRVKECMLGEDADQEAKSLQDTDRSRAARNVRAKLQPAWTAELARPGSF